MKLIIQDNETVAKGDQVIVFRVKSISGQSVKWSGWVEGQVVRYNKTTDTVRVKYTDGTQQTHMRTYKLDANLEEILPMVQHQVHVIGINLNLDKTKEYLIQHASLLQGSVTTKELTKVVLRTWLENNKLKFDHAREIMANWNPYTERTETVRAAGNAIYFETHVLNWLRKNTYDD